MKVTEARYELISGDRLPAGKVCRIQETPGLAVVEILTGEATERLCEELNEFHRSLLAEERWLQTPIVDPQRIEQAPEGLGIATAEWELRPDLPTVLACAPIEKRNHFTWFIHQEHASTRLVREMNRYLLRIVGDGLWRQNWT
ncbi:hypothetical protein ACFUJ0_06240 [Streptomyces sp. NPDC057242]|uniref:hypothetical protein n=1 Tax=unclassified Streptomyces TaxID=2593676 RepID=UPI00363B2572